MNIPTAHLVWISNLPADRRIVETEIAEQNIERIANHTAKERSVRTNKQTAGD